VITEMSPIGDYAADFPRGSPMSAHEGRGTKNKPWNLKTPPGCPLYHRQSGARDPGL